jgi:pseudouridine synthase
MPRDHREPAAAPARASRPKRASQRTFSRPSHPFIDDSRGPRLQKVLADLGVGSRRRCEELIEAGEVRVNGEIVASLPAWVDPLQDRIEVEGRPLRSTSTKPVVIMLHKPRGTVCTNSDPEGRTRAIDLVRMPGNPRLYPVGRLDMDSSGLLLLTNDGGLANLLTHPRFEVHKTYEVLVDGRLEEEDVRRLEEGVFLPERRKAGASGGRRAAGSRLTLIRRDRERTLLSMELGEGRNRQVRRMLLRVGHPVRRLKRVKLGPLELKGLAVGEWKILRSSEVKALRSAAERAIAAR